MPRTLILEVAMPEVDVWESGIYTTQKACRICQRTINVRQGKNNDWALCAMCHNGGYAVIRKENGQIEYRGPRGIFSGPDSK